MKCRSPDAQSVSVSSGAFSPPPSETRILQAPTTVPDYSVYNVSLGLWVMQRLFFECFYRGSLVFYFSVQSIVSIDVSHR